MHRPIRRDEMIIEAGGSVRSLGMAADSRTNPCNGCDRKNECMANNMACEAYSWYTWKHYAKPAELDSLPRNPTKALFDKIYRGE